MKPRIWLTRPEAQASSTKQVFEALGFEVLCVPVLSIEPIVKGPLAETIRARILDFDRYHLAIFVSQNAVQYGCAWLDEFWPQLPEGCKFLAVGTATHQALQKAGLPVVGYLSVNSAMNSESLLALPELAEVKDKAILVFRGEGGRTFLGDSLRQRGARVDYCELYQRGLPAQAQTQVNLALARGKAWLSAHSGESLQNLVGLLRAATLKDIGRQSSGWLQWPLLVPGARVEALAKTFGFSQIIVAENAADLAMSQALQCVITQL